MTMKTVQVGDEVLRKGPWMPEEDEILVEYVRQFGPRDWSSIRSKGLLPRTGKSCRLRWVNKLKPDLKRSGCKFSPEEEKLVVEMQAKLGNKWAKIASCLPGRTDNDVKNFWSTRQKRLMRALQRPKTPSGKSENGTDLSEISKDSALNEFTAFQVQSPSRSPPLTFGFGAPLYFGEDDVFREQQTHMGDHWRMRHDLQAFSSFDLDDVLSMKLQDYAGADFPFTEMEFAGSERYSKDDIKSMPTLSHPYTASPLKNSVKRRPRSRRGAKPCTEQPPINEPEMPECGGPLFEQTSSNYLDFVLLPEAASVQSNQAFCPDLSGFLLTSPQWEKLPMLYLDSDSGLDDCSKEGGASTTPDSVLSSFPGDVFDSLEPLYQASSEWWASRLT